MDLVSKLEEKLSSISPNAINHNISKNENDDENDINYDPEGYSNDEDNNANITNNTNQNTLDHNSTTYYADPNCIMSIDNNDLNYDSDTSNVNPNYESNTNLANPNENPLDNGDLRGYILGLTDKNIIKGGGVDSGLTSNGFHYKKMASVVLLMAPSFHSQ
jgi:hypothetical protein